jgi:hypothetical protein
MNVPCPVCAAPDGPGCPFCRGVQAERPPGATRGGPVGVQLDAPPARAFRRPPPERRGLRRLAWALGGGAALLAGTAGALRLALAFDFPDPPVSVVLCVAFSAAALLVCYLREV